MLNILNKYRKEGRKKGRKEANKKAERKKKGNPISYVNYGKL